jgi:hypothetical protein
MYSGRQSTTKYPSKTPKFFPKKSKYFPITSPIKNKFPFPPKIPLFIPLSGMNFDQSIADNQLTMSSLSELPSLLRRILDSSRFQVHEKPFDDLLKIYDYYNYDVQKATEQYFYE